jgi:hypothetical protein
MILNGDSSIMPLHLWELEPESDPLEASLELDMKGDFENILNLETWKPSAVQKIEAEL